MLHRRRLILAASASALAACAPSPAAKAEPSRGQARFASDPWRRLTPEDWRARLSSAAYRVLREEGTERPGSSPLELEKRRGVFHCAGCDLPLFRSEWKYDSGTGWPSFWRAIEANIGTKQDFVLFYPRTEYHCGRCLGHQGHVFDDGPRPTGLRYCNNGVALIFKPAPALARP